ncbi:hypothetical protein [Paenibacillus nasutitermitis]|uniref:Uncharacterized protein n=1 Tax=Paenibacillus nasutitermitis TaxID=1652958 RepID=A0A917DME5_9BACL|nr:hypothetical protein [Paenibacillus nasutitermitis]GGD49376.1 hypothetical protein GCM10010911_03620 [Paenibacillus nasutitermitis]
MWNIALNEDKPIITAILLWLWEIHRMAAQPVHEDSLFQSCPLRVAAADLIANRSYETGLPCGSGAKILHADPIWSRKTN